MLDSEQMIVGAILGDYRTLRTIRAELADADFQTEAGRAVFRAACILEDDGKTIDPVTIKEQAAIQGAVLSDQDLLQAMEVAAVASNLHVHIQGMRDAVLRSELLSAVSSAHIRLMQEEPPQIVCADLQKDVQRTVERDNRNNLISSCDAMLDFTDHRVAVENGMKKAFVPTGFNSLDNALGGGMVPEGLYILAARPGCGKTTLGLQIAEKVASCGIPVLFVSLEMAMVQLTARRLAVETGIPSGSIMLHSLTQEEHQRVADAMDMLQARPLFFNRERRATVGSVGVQARQVKGCGLVVLDYLGLLQYEQGKTIYEQVTKTSNSLKRLACSLGVPVLCLAQLNREMEGRKGPPRLSDLRDSGAIEQDADGVLLLHRPPIEEGEGPASLVCSIAKNRHGPAGADVEFNWYLRTGRIRPIHNERLKNF